ncbi:hypothetical protein SARC_01838 [Sphaeroforma arctica JP610]|uniref:Uncharacterized protein n=1 Tax=Sphaeroforma arctica JP610 TaxID=667725 RepID=A0A0L0GCL7_9EUKA|nr:hypothetical protein SARC_01838 [Sphaeroforma arctica JP610]KNC85993.1 hypothetical protein SARC_01838 [Sphaeroforma arctica JP610]|eukprot:XP_014159895.1 hypothetical protein SARC_01838 [Sphaeroforma arctica JP610]
MPTATRAGIYGGDGDDTNKQGAYNSSEGESTPGNNSSASAMRLEIDTSICHVKCFLVSRNIPKLEATAPVAIASLHKMRVGIHDQQPERRMPLVDIELRKRYDQVSDACGDDEDDEVCLIKQYISELEIMCSRVGIKMNEPAVFELLKLKAAEFPKLPSDDSFKTENCKDIIEFTMQCRGVFLAKSMTLCQYPTLVRYLLDYTEATEKTNGGSQ